MSRGKKNEGELLEPHFLVSLQTAVDTLNAHHDDGIGKDQLLEDLEQIQIAIDDIDKELNDTWDRRRR